MKIAILGYGNLGKGIECAVQQNDDFELFGVFSKRPASEVSTLFNTPVYSSDDIVNYKDEIDCVIACGGSATDLPVVTPEIAKNFNVVDSFDTHANIPSHYNKVDEVAKKSNHLALISAG